MCNAKYGLAGVLEQLTQCWKSHCSRFEGVDDG